MTLPDEVIKLIEKEKISQGHAKILIGQDNSLLLAKKIISKNMSVRQTEALIRSLRINRSGKVLKKDSNILSLENSLKDKTGINVFIKNKKNKTGQLSFEYKDLDQLNRLIMVIKANY